LEKKTRPQAKDWGESGPGGRFGRGHDGKPPEGEQKRRGSRIKVRTITDFASLIKKKSQRRRPWGVADKHAIRGLKENGAGVRGVSSGTKRGGVPVSQEETRSTNRERTTKKKGNGGKRRGLFYKKKPKNKKGRFG